MGLIDCPEARGPKARQTIINTKNLKPEDLYSSTTSKDIHKGRSLAELKEQKQNFKDPATIEEWDCPRPGENKNKKIVRENTKKMQKKQRQKLDSLNTVHAGMTMEKN
jgi:hypothetical protein